MKIKLLRVFLFVLMAAILFLSCNENEHNCTTDLNNKWEATEFKSIESVHYTKVDGKNPVVEFKANGTIIFQLDKNNGIGTFEIIGNKKLEITNLGWTDMCCDSSFSEKFVEMLPQVTSYSIEEKTLNLYVPEWGWIELKLLN